MTRKSIRGSIGRPTKGERSAGRPHFALLTTLLAVLAIGACDTASDVAGPGTDVDLSRATLEVVGGDGQEAQVGSTTPEPLAVRVLDETGIPVPGAFLEWTFTQGRGRSANVSGVASEVVVTETDAQGVSEVRWELGTQAGVQAVEVALLVPEPATPPPPSGVSGAPGNSNGKKVGFQARAKPAGPAEVTVSPSDIDAQPDVTVALTAEVIDQYGNVIEDPTLSWSSSDVSVASVGGSGTVTTLAEGSAQIAAKTGPVEGTTTVTVEAAPTPDPSSPGAVGDLRAVGTTETSVTLRWTQVGDGDGGAADYALRMGSPTISWADAYPSEVTVAGTSVGQTREYTWSGLTAGATYQFRLVAFRGELGNGAVFGGLSNTASGTTDSQAVIIAEVRVSPSGVALVEGETATFTAAAFDEGGVEVDGVDFSWRSSAASVLEVDGQGRVTALAAGSTNVIASAGEVEGSQAVTVEASSDPEPSAPGRVIDLQVVSTSETGVTLRWTQVSDGSGTPADYAVRVGSPTISWGEASETEVVVNGTDIASTLEYEWSGLDAGTAYEFQLVAFGGQLGEDAVFGELSNVAASATDGPEVAAVIASPETVRLVAVGDTATLSVTAENSVGEVVEDIAFEFSSSDPTIVEVDTMGFLTARGLGNALIWVAATCCAASDSVVVEVPEDATGDDTSASGAQPFFSTTFPDGIKETNDDFNWNGGNDVSTSDDNAYIGTHSLKFTYGPDTPGGSHVWSEQRFSIPNGAAGKEIWFEFRFYIPDGTESYGGAAYSHDNVSGESANNKIWKLYDVDGAPYNLHAILEANPVDSPAISKTRPSWGTNSAKGGLPSSDWGSLAGGGEFIDEVDRGTWMHLKFQIKASDPGQSNGIWRGWKNGRLIIEDTGIANDAVDGELYSWLGGYLGGWDNGEFAERTYLFVDDIKFYANDPGWR